MSSLKNKIFSFFKKTKHSLDVFLFSKSSGRLDQIDIDKKLVYSLSPRKIPNKNQFKYLKKFLNPKENLIIKICLLVIVINLAYLGVVFSAKYFDNVPVSGGAYIEGVVGYPKAINPLYASSRDIDNDLSRLIYSRLFNYNDKGQIVSDLTKDYSISEDKKEYTVVIKDNVYWHNGNNLNADDVVFTFNLIKNENYNSPLRQQFSGITIEKIDEKTVKFILPEVYSPFLEMLTFGIMPKHIWQTIGPEAIALNDFNLKPIGSGPYKFKTLIRSKGGDIKEYILEANETYYEKVPYIEEFSFIFFPSHEEAIRSFNDNNIDGLSVLPYSNRSDILSKESVQIYNLSRPQLVGLFFNLEEDIFQDKELRRGLSVAVDRQQLVKDVYNNYYQVAYGPILKTSFAYNKEIEEKLKFSPEEAKEIMSSKDDINLEITVIDINQNQLVAEEIKEYWQDVGVNVDINLITLEQAFDVIKNRDFEVLLYGQAIGGDPDVFAFWHSSQDGSQGLNISNYQNEEVDNLLLEARTTVSKEERIDKYNQFQKILTEDNPAIFLYSPSYNYVHDKKVKGFNGQSVITPDDRFSEVPYWYTKTKKTWAK